MKSTLYDFYIKNGVNVQTLLLATNNQGKLVEIHSILSENPHPVVQLRLAIPADLQLELDVEETGNSYTENASLKAIAFCKASGLISLADDSGLEVDALNGEPGIRSARYAPVPDATDAKRRAYLLSRLQDQPRPWSAHFHCTVAIATPEGGLHFSEGQVYGEIIPEERGANGFGYDPIFYIHELGKTMAELSMDEKNQLSHRARAVRAALPLLYRLFE
jgi:XTP/dITP diphosphohydrolase